MKAKEDRSVAAPAGDWRLECEVRFVSGTRGRKRLQADEASSPSAPGRVPRVARLLALAHRFDSLLRAGEIRDYTDLATLAGVTRARVTQITNLLSLAPDIQEAILDLPPVTQGRDPITESSLRPVSAVPEWAKQRRRWGWLCERRGRVEPRREAGEE